jgi:hypothetical protein
MTCCLRALAPKAGALSNLLGMALALLSFYFCFKCFGPELNRVLIESLELGVTLIKKIHLQIPAIQPWDWI